MRHITTNEAVPFHQRLISIAPETIIGFPNTGDDKVLKLRSFQKVGDIALDRNMHVAEASVDISARRRYPDAYWMPVGFRKSTAGVDWQKLPHGEVAGWDDDHLIDDSQKERFAKEFNALMDAAKDGGWLLGAGQWVDFNRIEPPSAEFHRILVPNEPGVVGLAESLDKYGSPNTTGFMQGSVVWVLHNIAGNLGATGLGD